jgi:hypothetical protein
MPFIPDNPLAAEILYELLSRSNRGELSVSLPVPTDARREYWNALSILFQAGFISQFHYTSDYLCLQFEIYPALAMNFD